MSAKSPGIRLHPRTMQVQRAGAALTQLLLDWQEEHDLTCIETATALTGQLDRQLKYALRHERHPRDPERKADEK